MLRGIEEEVRAHERHQQRVQQQAQRDLKASSCLKQSLVAITAFVLFTLFVTSDLLQGYEFHRWLFPLQAERRVIVSLTTTYDRLSMVNCTIKSIQLQTVKPDEILINIPWKSRRFHVPYPTPSLKELRALPDENTKITINRCEDHGPGTKFIPSINRELQAGRRESLIVVIDDDVYYPRDHLETLLQGAEDTNYEKAVGLRGWCVHASDTWTWHIMANRFVLARNMNESQILPVDIITANNGLLVIPKFFEKVSINITKESPESAYYMDDIWINGILAANRIERVVVPIRVEPQHRGAVERRSHTLESVPMGRAYHNTKLLHHFSDVWSHCHTPVPPTIKKRLRPVFECYP